MCNIHSNIKETVQTYLVIVVISSGVMDDGEKMLTFCWPIVPCYFMAEMDQGHIKYSNPLADPSIRVALDDWSYTEI